jgi:hypothetical protein
MRRDTSKPDPVFLAGAGVAFLLCLIAITVTRLHPDAMAFLPLFPAGKWPLDPGWFEKPPFYAYCNYVLNVAPLSLAAQALGLGAGAARATEIVWARILLAGALLGSSAIVFRVARRPYGVGAARVVAAVLVTSAGMIAFVHQLTADVPVTFWMVAAFAFAAAILREPRPRNYLAAGLLTGVATATKYNGLGVGIALVAAHLLRALMERPPAARWRRALLDRRLIAGLAMVPAGFVAANPFAVLDHRAFVADFRYNYVVAPVYEGQSGHSFATFFARIAEVVGVPAFVVFVLATVLSMYLVTRHRRLSLPEAMFWTTFAVCALYYAKFAPFPRLETRFVLPIVPFWLLLSAPGWAWALRRSNAAGIVAAVLVAYNVLCGAYVGVRFRADPRIAAAAWLRTNAPADSTIESDIYSPDGHEAGSRLRTVTVPFVTGRERLFQRIFPGNDFVNGSQATRQAAEERVRWFSAAELARRAPDFVVVDSLYYDRFVQPGLRSELYPEMRAYFTDLLAERAGYRIVLDRRSPSVPALVYPRAIDFLDNRVTILARSTGGH